MSSAAVWMMVVAIGTVWGALVAAVIYLARHPEEPDD